VLVNVAPRVYQKPKIRVEPKQELASGDFRPIINPSSLRMVEGKHWGQPIQERWRVDVERKKLKIEAAKLEREKETEAFFEGKRKREQAVRKQLQQKGAHRFENLGEIVGKRKEKLLKLKLRCTEDINEKCTFSPAKVAKKMEKRQNKSFTQGAEGRPISKSPSAPLFYVVRGKGENRRQMLLNLLVKDDSEIPDS